MRQRKNEKKKILTGNRIVDPKNQPKKIETMHNTLYRLKRSPIFAAIVSILEKLKDVMTKEFWKLPNSWDLKKTPLTSNTIAGVEEYLHTVEPLKGYQIKERYIDRCF